jgi:hypothetical protein
VPSCAGFDPRIHQKNFFAEMMGCRVKPVNDELPPHRHREGDDPDLTDYPPVILAGQEQG